MEQKKRTIQQACCSLATEIVNAAAGDGSEATPNGLAVEQELIRFARLLIEIARDGEGGEPK